MSKSPLQIILSIFLALTIVAPSVLTLIDDSEKLEIVLEQNEDDNQKESKEGEQEQKVKDTFYQVWNNSMTSNLIECSKNTFYIPDGYNRPLLNIFLPPPEAI